jgi:DNA-binding transcriptional regulator LsrR (DeoR family)
MGSMATEREQATRFSPALMHNAASLYYEGDATQAEIAKRLGVSRATVSRLLAEARRAGIVRIQVIAPIDRDLDALGERLAAALGLDAVWIPGVSTRGTVGENLSDAATFCSSRRAGRSMRRLRRRCPTFRGSRSCR